MDKPQLRPGRVKCLRCSNLFDSRDIPTNRICPSCTKLNEKEYIPRIIASSVYGGDGSGHRIESDD